METYAAFVTFPSLVRSLALDINPHDGGTHQLVANIPVSPILQEVPLHFYHWINFLFFDLGGTFLLPF